MKKLLCLVMAVLGALSAKPYDLLFGRVTENGKVDLFTEDYIDYLYTIPGHYKPGDLVKIRYRNYCGDGNDKIETLYSVELVEAPEELDVYLRR